MGCLFFLFSFCFVWGRIGHASSSLVIIIMISPLPILILILLMGISHILFFSISFQDSQVMFRLWSTYDTNNDYYFKLCEETTLVPQGRYKVWAPSLHIFLYLFSQKHQTTKQQCPAGTQVCQKDFFAHIYSCGVYPVTSAYETGSGKGVVMYASGGSIDGCTQGRQSYLEVLCPKGTGYSSGTFGPVTQKQACVYTFPFYHDVGCPTNSPTSQSDGSFLFFLFFMIYSHTPKKQQFLTNTNGLTLFFSSFNSQQ